MPLFCLEALTILPSKGWPGGISLGDLSLKYEVWTSCILHLVVQISTLNTQSHWTTTKVGLLPFSATWWRSFSEMSIIHIHMTSSGVTEKIKIYFCNWLRLPRAIYTQSDRVTSCLSYSTLYFFRHHQGKLRLNLRKCKWQENETLTLCSKQFCVPPGYSYTLDTLWFWQFASIDKSKHSRSKSIADDLLSFPHSLLATHL